VGPRAYRSLHQLHEKVSKENQTPIIPNFRPSFSYKKGEQPTFTFLSQMASPSERKEEPSSDYGSGWMDDLPSPSALFRTNYPVKTKAAPASDDYEIDPDILPKRFTSTCPDLDNGGSYAADLQNIGRSVTDAATSVSNMDEEAIDDMESARRVEVSQYFTTGQPEPSVNQNSHDKLFMSTDSPAKPSSPPLKRKTAEPSIGEQTHLVQEGKKPKVDNLSSSSSLQPSSTTGYQDANPAPAIKPGHPAWVYDFDPSFIAEWEPYVEFV
ncbi:MAG: hypothetical protein Q9224_007209, partial [Gallowayella concinna]